MPKRFENLIPGEIYHFYNRGVNRQPIFFSDRNYHYFINRMQTFLKDKAEIYGFCLMPNHYHLLAKVLTVDFVAKGLQLMLMSYVKAINIEQQRVGPLFQGRFQSTLIGNNEENIFDCLGYIHLNPVKAGLVKSPDLWEYSSYGYYLSPNKKTFINTEPVLNYFSNTKEFTDFHTFNISDDNPKFFVNEK